MSLVIENLRGSMTPRIPDVALPLLPRQDEDGFKRIRKMTSSDLPMSPTEFHSKIASVPSSYSLLTLKRDKPPKDCFQEDGHDDIIAGRGRSRETVGVKDRSSRFSA